MGFGQLKKQADQANIVVNHPHLVHQITDPLPEHVETVEAAKIVAALGQEEASRLAAEKARLAKEAEEVRLAKEAEDARIAKEAEDARIAKEAEDARLAKEAEEARLAKEAEDARLAKETEDARLAKEAEDARLAKEAEDARLAKEAEDARLAKEAEDARLAKETEDARLAKEAEDARLAKEAEDARLAKEAEDARLAKEAADKAAADALAKAKCPVLDETDVKANTKFVLKSVYNAKKHNAVYDKTLKLQDAIKNNQDFKLLVDDFLTSNSKSFINTVSDFGDQGGAVAAFVGLVSSVYKEKEGCLQATNNPTGNADYCKYIPTSKKNPYNKDSVQTFVDTKLLSKTAQGVVKSLDDAKQNYCDAFNLFKAALDGKDCLKLVVEGYCNTTDTVNAAAHDVLCNSFDWTQFDSTVC